MIRGELVNLRAIERADLELIHGWFNDPDLMHSWGIPVPAVSRADLGRRIEEWIERERTAGHAVCFMIELLDGAAIGVAIVTWSEQQPHVAELSLLIGDASHWGQGLGTDALTALVDCSFEQWRLHRVSVRAEALNARAQRLYERCGFTKEAVLRGASFFDGAFHDQVLYSRLATDPDLEEGPAT
jgi:RimJ/RimL family protein N-acetyltransferase